MPSQALECKLCTPHTVTDIIQTTCFMHAKVNSTQSAIYRHELSPMHSSLCIHSTGSKPLQHALKHYIQEVDLGAGGLGTKVLFSDRYIELINPVLPHLYS